MQELAKSSIKRFPECDITLHDWQSSEVKAIIESFPEKKSSKKKKKKQQQPPLHEQPDYKRGQMQKLVELLDKNWDNFYSQKLEAHVYDAKNDQFLEITVPSSFSKYLVQQPWLPSTIQPSSGDRFLYKGSELYNQSSTEVQKLLHTHAPFLDAKLQSAEFMKHLKIHSSISRLHLLEYLVAWSKMASAQSSEGGKGFSTSMDHMIAVYSFLLENAGQDVIDKFTEESSSLIFVPNRLDKSIKSSDDVDGRFISVHDACWMDPTSVLYKKQELNWSSLPETLPKVLSLHYIHISQLKELFR